jgi:hypothetical protein
MKPGWKRGTPKAVATVQKVGELLLRAHRLTTLRKIKNQLDTLEALKRLGK